MEDFQIRIIRALRDGIPLTVCPYEELASKAGVSLDDLLAQLRQWKADGTIRRFGAILRHHRAGYAANAMVAWDVPEELIDRFAEAASSLRNVSHCYQRPRFPGFDYNVYTMIHGASNDDCEQAIETIEKRSSIHRKVVLYTTAEFKKTGPVYFPECPETSR